MGKYFGTDGFRGEANVQLTVDHAFKVGRYVGWQMCIRDRVKAIAEACGVKKQQVFVGVGSDAVSYTHLFCEGELTGEFMQEDATQEKLLQSATRQGG